MRLIDARNKHAEAKRHMAAFDALPPDVRDFIRAANLGWDCIKLRRRIDRANTAKRSQWGLKRLLEQYRNEDVAPASDPA